ncbi:hypothetical protein HETIRDRAFT_103360 [Heterobasidion irregulare TC 32-1]|uniref:Uncharacterized protein n=1 Tax=Heterobasidion irregulare (strain TC 32-1) TaxID=747525 RepID=W4K2S6_HETIT|nr:uncharacterized protein HETIRDRAFT_103360 [Heterobasidion irregulare TC 32-1]ETW80128.1 hypothetical protein HETIRDRAFT_103360 [Heterobasidion irregulare TC 32-1]
MWMMRREKRKRRTGSQRLCLAFYLAPRASSAPNRVAPFCPLGNLGAAENRWLKSRSSAQRPSLRTTHSSQNSTAGNPLFSAFHPALFHAPQYTSSLTHRRRHQTPQLPIGAAETPSDTLADTVPVSSDSTAQKDLQAPALWMRTLPASSSAQ